VHIFFIIFFSSWDHSSPQRSENEHHRRLFYCKIDVQSFLLHKNQFLLKKFRVQWWYLHEVIQENQTWEHVPFWVEFFGWRTHAINKQSKHTWYLLRIRSRVGYCVWVYFRCIDYHRSHLPERSASVGRGRGLTLTLSTFKIDPFYPQNRPKKSTLNWPSKSTLKIDPQNQPKKCTTLKIDP